MDIITIIAISNGIQYLYKFVKIAGFYYSSVEIANKINVRETIRHLDNLNTMVEVSLALSGGKSIKRKNEKKKYKHNYMERMYKAVCSLFHSVSIQRLERQERLAEKRKEILFNEKRRREKVEDEKREKEMFDRGWLRDKTSRHYIAPDKMLEDIHTALVKAMSDDKWSNDDRLVIKRLVLEEGRLEDFEKYEDLFYYVEVLDRVTRRPFESVLLNDVVYSPNSIMYLQQKKKEMVYVNVAVVNFENKCVV